MWFILGMHGCSKFENQCKLVTLTEKKENLYDHLNTCRKHIWQNSALIQALKKSFCQKLEIRLNKDPSTKKL